jgi:hypothetical protein
MTPRDLYAVLVRLLGLTTATWALSLMLVNLADELPALVIGVALWLAAGPMASVAYGPAPRPRGE